MTDSNTTPDLPAPEDDAFEQLIALHRLRLTWNHIRREARESTARDAVDFVDWAVTIESSLKSIQVTLSDGTYAPGEPFTFEYPKAKGAFRVITAPNMRDTLVYRLIADEALARALPQKVGGSYFSRRHTSTPVGRTLDVSVPESSEDPYGESFQVWLAYQQYRTRTLLNELYPVLVVSDISNFFESISHELLFEYLTPLGLPRKAIGLLGRILDRLKPRIGHSLNPQIGIPSDEFECSRTLAHVFLFEHDRRIAERFGETNYVRWMDDMNVGAADHTRGRHVVNEIARSLSLQRLTLNTGKTRFLPLEDVEAHFYLEANARLAQWQERYYKRTSVNLEEARGQLQDLWEWTHERYEEAAGNWDKVLKRFYRLAANVNLPLLDDRAAADIVEYPLLAQVVFSYFATNDRWRELRGVFEGYCAAGECLFETVEAWFFEACLMMNLDAAAEEEALGAALQATRGDALGRVPGSVGRVPSTLCVFWFDASPQALAELFSDEQARHLPAPVARAWLAVCAAREFSALREAQAKLVGNAADDVAKLSHFLTALSRGDIESVGYYKHQRKMWAARGKLYDARAWLQLELLAASSSEKLRSTAQRDFPAFAKLVRTRQENRVHDRVAARFGR